MLPDYPEIKSEFDALFDRFIKARVHEHLGPVWGQAANRRQFEGESLVTHWSHGGQHEAPMRRFSQVFSVERKEIPTLSLQDIVERIDDTARNLAELIAKGMYASMSETIEKAGRVCDAEGKPISPEAILEMLEKIDMDFSDGKEFKLPTLIVSPQLAERATEAKDALENDPLYRNRLDEVLSRKREEWLAREANRKLDG